MNIEHLRPQVRRLAAKTASAESQVSLQYTQLRRGEVESVALGVVNVYLSGDLTITHPCKTMMSAPAHVGDQVWILRNGTDLLIIGVYVADNGAADTGWLSMASIGANWTNLGCSVRRVGSVVAARWILQRTTSVLAANSPATLWTTPTEMYPDVAWTFEVGGDTSEGTAGRLILSTAGVGTLQNHEGLSIGQFTEGSAVWFTAPPE